MVARLDTQSDAALPDSPDTRRGSECLTAPTVQAVVRSDAMREELSPLLWVINEGVILCPAGTSAIFRMVVKRSETFKRGC
ncbi:MAG: hypothetical protein AAF236_00430 [Verrucomicrobiota bacterium]